MATVWPPERADCRIKGATRFHAGGVADWGGGIMQGETRSVCGFQVTCACESFEPVDAGAPTCTIKGSSIDRDFRSCAVRVESCDRFGCIADTRSMLFGEESDVCSRSMVCAFDGGLTDR